MVNKLNKIKEDNSIAVIKSRHTEWPEIICAIDDIDNEGVTISQVDYLNGFFPKSSRQDGTYFIDFRKITFVKDYYEV